MQSARYNYLSVSVQHEGLRMRSPERLNAAHETYNPMTLRVPSLPAMLLVGLALTFAPAGAQTQGTFSTTPQPSPYSGTIVEERIAQVNDQIISKSDYERAEQEMEQEAHQQNWTQQQIFEQRRDLLRSLIDRQLLLSKGKELAITGETDLVKRLDDIRKQYNLASMEDLQKAVEEQGISYEDFKEQIREGIITQAVISQEVGPHISVAQSEVDDYYNTHKQEFQQPEEVKLNEILISTPSPDDAAQVADAEKKADGIETRLKAGADFATVAKADSGGPTAQDGGRLGSYKRGDLPKVMEDATFGLQPGQFTQPIRTKQGWLILEVSDHQKAGLLPLPSVENQIQEEVGMSKMEPALRAYLTTLRDQAYIDIRPGYVDSGASANELKFIQSAYVPPSPKKKKHVQRARYAGRPGRGHKAASTAAAAPPAGVPTLDKVNSQSGQPSEVASNAGTQKPGKREKIRFGQAPRETLPSGSTRQVDAGAGAAPAPQEQVAINQPGMAPVANPLADAADTTAKQGKTRLTDRLKEPKAKREAESAANKHQKFVPPPETQTPAALAAQQRENSALGLKGDTTKTKKVNSAKSGPKRRLSDQEKKNEENQQQNGSPAPAPSTTPAPTTPQTTPPSTGTAPTHP
jgi:peptidyl-prolyl cis-trans isomerase SurA